MLQGTDISFLQIVQTSSGTHPDSYLVGVRGSFPTGKVARPWN